jgi:hypothetical protein
LWPLTCAFSVERVTGIEPALSAWESDRSRPIRPAEQPTSGTVSSRECPLMTLVNCTLIARRPSVFQAGHIPSWHGSCERYALSPVAAACRWSLPLLSRLLSTRRRPPISKPTRTLQGMARVESGQAPAWPSGSDRRRHRGSAVRGGRRPFPAETRSALDGGGVPPHPQRAIPGTSPGRSGLCDDRRLNSGEDRG